MSLRIRNIGDSRTSNKGFTPFRKNAKMVLPFTTFFRTLAPALQMKQPICATQVTAPLQPLASGVLSDIALFRGPFEFQCSHIGVELSLTQLKPIRIVRHEAYRDVILQRCRGVYGEEWKRWHSRSWRNEAHFVKTYVLQLIRTTVRIIYRLAYEQLTNNEI